MTERMVQVPVSLIERIDSAYNASADTLAALIEQLWMLSQTTPSAEPMCTCGHEARTHDAMSAGSFACHVLECRCRTFTATPPRIADMAPGTTFRIKSPFVSDADLWTVLLNDVDREKHALSTTGYDWMLDDIDPSTIRDVTPPADAS